MILDEWKPVPWWKTLLIFLVPGLVLGLLLGTCHRPTPPIAVPSSPDPYRAEAVSLSGATAAQGFKVTIKRPVGYEEGRHSRGGVEDAGNRPPSHVDAGPVTFEEIVIEGTQTVQASASAGASASVNQISDVTQLVPAHGRLGVVALTAPGILAADFQLARVDAPPWFIGMPLELGLDAVVNGQMAGAGVSAGGKGFATAGGWLGFQGGAGWYLGAGLRF